MRPPYVGIFPSLRVGTGNSYKHCVILSFLIFFFHSDEPSGTGMDKLQTPSMQGQSFDEERSSTAVFGDSQSSLGSYHL